MLADVFAKFQDADNAMECILNAMKETERNEKSIKLRMSKLGLQLPDEYKWTLEVSSI
jgi:hypothetical protein